MNWLIRRLKVHPNGYYNYKKQRKNAQKKKKASILKEIEKIYHERNGVPGYRLMKILLESKGIYLSAQTVRKYMNVDFTYIKLSKSNKRYNCTIIDLYSREVVASVNGKNINSQLAIDTLKEVLKKAGRAA